LRGLRRLLQAPSATVSRLQECLWGHPRAHRSLPALACRIDTDGWPTQAGQEITVTAGQRLVLTTRGACARGGGGGRIGEVGQRSGGRAHRKVPTARARMPHSPPSPAPKDVDCSSTEGGACLPVTYPRFADMAEAGDDIYVGRYLVSGADTASLYLKVGLGGGAGGVGRIEEQERGRRAQRGCARAGAFDCAPRRRGAPSPAAARLGRRRPRTQVEDVIDGTDVVCLAQNDALLDGLLTVFHVERSRWRGKAGRGGERPGPWPVAWVRVLRRPPVAKIWASPTHARRDPPPPPACPRPTSLPLPLTPPPATRCSTCRTTSRCCQTTTRSASQASDRCRGRRRGAPGWPCLGPGSPGAWVSMQPLKRSSLSPADLRDRLCVAELHALQRGRHRGARLPGLCGPHRHQDLCKDGEPPGGWGLSDGRQGTGCCQMLLAILAIAERICPSRAGCGALALCPTPTLTPPSPGPTPLPPPCARVVAAQL
jgi:hypothetical protein